MAHTLQHVVEIGRSPQDVYAYVTQPWRWHEWHPSSRSARADVAILRAGDSFDECIELQPLSPLPLRLRRQTRYRVLEAVPGEHWAARGEMRDGWLELRYRLTPTPRGTRFERSLSYAAGGASRLLMPLLAPRMARLSELALAHLARRLESGGDA